MIQCETRGYSETDSSWSSFRVSGDICLTPSSGSRVAKRSLGKAFVKMSASWYFVFHEILTQTTFLSLLFDKVVSDIMCLIACIPRRGACLSSYRELFFEAVHMRWMLLDLQKPLVESDIDNFIQFAVEEGGFHVHLEDDHVHTCRVSNEESDRFKSSNRRKDSSKSNTSFLDD
ncbi:hypothetical protein Tco_0222473 [Tanacetum coccineum]